MSTNPATNTKGPRFVLLDQADPGSVGEDGRCYVLYALLSNNAARVFAIELLHDGGEDRQPNCQCICFPEKFSNWTKTIAFLRKLHDSGITVSMQSCHKMSDWPDFVQRYDGLVLGEKPQD